MMRGEALKETDILRRPNNSWIVSWRKKTEDEVVRTILVQGNRADRTVEGTKREKIKLRWEKHGKDFTRYESAIRFQVLMEIGVIWRKKNWDEKEGKQEGLWQSTTSWEESKGHKDDWSSKTRQRWKVIKEEEESWLEKIVGLACFWLFSFRARSSNESSRILFSFLAIFELLASILKRNTCSSSRSYSQSHRSTIYWPCTHFSSLRSLR